MAVAEHRLHRCVVQHRDLAAGLERHELVVVGRYRGLTGGLYYFINLEKVDEIPNDLLRLIVTYEF